MDYDKGQRFGQCHKPMTSTSLRFFAILHQKLRSLGHCLKQLYHLVSGQTHTWSESNLNVKQALTVGKKEAIDHIRAKCGFLVDCPTVIGGNSNSGPIADRFFSPKNREDNCSLIWREQDQLYFSKLLSYFNQMLSITQ